MVPNGEWERCSRETGLPLLVCNRTGIDRTLRFTAAESLVAKRAASALVYVRMTTSRGIWRRRRASREPQRVDL